MKIVFLITARLKSPRLPYKIMLDLNGKTVLERVIERAKQVKGIDDIVVCTSTNPQDKPIIDIAKEQDVYYYNGSEKDVVKRLLTAAKLHNIDYFVAITADNPLFSIRYSDRIVDILKQLKPDYVKVIGLPLGTDTYGVSRRALEAIYKTKSLIDTEHWKYLIDRRDVFKIRGIDTGHKYNENIRLTLDYIEDYDLIRDIYNNFGDCIPNLRDVIEYIIISKSYKKNQHCKQIVMDEQLRKIIDKDFKRNESKIKEILGDDN